jgi:hypothetical protein
MGSFRGSESRTFIVNSSEGANVVFRIFTVKGDESLKSSIKALYWKNKYEIKRESKRGGRGTGDRGGPEKNEGK